VEIAGVCTPCPVGTFSVTSGTSGADSCAACPDGQSSAAGSVACSSSGCTDPYATNYDANAIVDLGLCEYTCSSLRAIAQVGDVPGSCLIYDSASDSWKRYDATDAETGGAVFRIGSSRDGPFQFGGEHWIVQGRPLAGSTVDAALYPSYAVGEPSELAYAGFQTGNTRMHIRYTDISSVTATTSTRNSGAAMRLQSDACTMEDGAGGISCFIFFDHVNFADSACDYGGSTGIYGADLQTVSTPTVSMSYVTYSGNTAIRNGGAIRTGGGAQTYSNCAFDGNEAVEEFGGAIYMAHEQSTVVASLTSTAFKNNVSPEGGAVYMTGDCSATFTSVSFMDNLGRANGGSIFVAGARLEVIDTNFVHDFAAGLGVHIYARTADLLVRGTVFSPDEDDGSLGVYLVDTAAGCDATPCAAGETCSYSDFSTTCSPCPQFTYSSDGLACSICAPGSAPSADKTTCEACPADTYSQYGTECASSGSGSPTYCAMDTNNDGWVGVDDLLIMLAAFGQSTGGC
jgi:predicted outer membrane repeat protein